MKVVFDEKIFLMKMVLMNLYFALLGSPGDLLGVSWVVVDFGQFRLRPIFFFEFGQFDFGQFRFRPISISANFDHLNVNIKKKRKKKK